MIFIFVFEKCQNSFSWGPPFGPFWSAKYLNFGGESCEIRILSRSIQETYTLRKVKNQVLLFLSSSELNLSDFMVYFCLFQNAILHRAEAKVLKFSAHFSQNVVFIGCNILSLLLVICLSWNLHLKLSKGYLTFISFNIWRQKCRSISSSHVELVTWHFGSQMVFPNI